VAQTGRYVVLRTNPATDFRGAIAKDAALFADFVAPPGVGEEPYLVQSVEIISMENLAWELWFFNKAMASIPVVPGTDWFRGRWSFQASDAVRVGAAGVYHYSIDGLAIPSECSDYDGHPNKYAQLHMALVNRSAASKTADDPGALVVQLILNAGLQW
jgi:hypothetical protein